jgi:hypothetical protein
MRETADQQPREDRPTWQAFNAKTSQKAKTAARLSRGLDDFRKDISWLRAPDDIASFDLSLGPHGNLL